jgi:hypothetical protein
VASVRAPTILALAALVLPVPAATAASIHGSARADRITGTARADRIDVRFGGIDRVTCGKGTDVVAADAGDVVSPDCEVVSRVVSTDPLLAAGGQHQTEVEPSAASSGSTVVAAFQVGRFRDGGAAAIGWATSTNAGRSWRSGLLPGITAATSPAGDAPRASDPSVAYDAAHRTWLVATLVLGTDYTALDVSRSADGVVWSAPTSAARAATSALGYDKEWIACDNTPTSPYVGSCYLAYTDELEPRVALEVSHDGGATWSAPVTVISAFGADAEGALPLIQPDGAVTVVALAQAGIYAARSTDGGATFAPEVGIAPVQEASVPLLRAPPLPTAVVDRSGRIYVVWADCRFRTGCNGNTLVLSTSTDGTTWTAPARIPGTGFDSFVPALAADATVPGRLGIVTYVRTGASCTAATCSLGVSVTESRDGGATWSVPQRLDPFPAPYSWFASTTEGQFVGDYVGAAFAGGRFVPVYAFASAPLPGGRLREQMQSAAIP